MPAEEKTIANEKLDLDFTVAFADIAGWSKVGLADQIQSASNIFARVKALMDLEEFSPKWVASTGDGFALGFVGGPTQRYRLVNLFWDLLDVFPKLRLSVAVGDARKYHNDLTTYEDYAGPGIIDARRILDGITDGGVMLVQEHLAEQVVSKFSEYLKQSIVQHPEIIDKHGEHHKVRQFLSRNYQSPAARSDQSDFFLIAKQTTHKIIKEMESRLDLKLRTIDQLVVLWMSNPFDGLEAAAIRIAPHWIASRDRSAITTLPNLPGDILEAGERYREEERRRAEGEIRDKTWLRDYRLPLEDRRFLQLTVGKSDYVTNRCVERAFDEQESRLLMRVEQEKEGIDRILPGMIVAENILFTSDTPVRVIIAQRKSRDVDWAKGNYSLSSEEQWDPRLESSPNDTVLRGLEEEFNLDKSHGVDVTWDNLKLVALAREWGAHWNTLLLYSVNLRALSRHVLNLWNGMPAPKDRNEHIAVAAIPFDERGIDFMARSLDTNQRILRDELIDVCGKDFVAGEPSDQELHPLSGRARMLLALAIQAERDPNVRPKIQTALSRFNTG